MNPRDYQEAIDRINQRIDDLRLLKLSDTLDNLDALVSEMLDTSIDTLGNEYINDPDNVLGLLAEALDQIVERGSDTVTAPQIEFVDEAALILADEAPRIGVSLEQVGQITNQALQFAASNNYYYIHQVIPAIRNDINQVFLDGIKDGLHPSQIEEILRTVGLPWSPTGMFSPGERAAMIANAEYNRIMSAMRSSLAAEAGIDMCINKINTSLKSHSDICLAATAAGLISEKTMRDKYLMPPRHPRCGCHIEYYDPDWGLHQASIQRNFDSLAQYGYSKADVEAAAARYKPETVNRITRYRENEQWKNKVIERLTPP